MLIDKVFGWKAKVHNPGEMSFRPGEDDAMEFIDGIMKLGKHRKLPQRKATNEEIMTMHIRTMRGDGFLYPIVELVPFEAGDDHYRIAWTADDPDDDEEELDIR